MNIDPYIAEFIGTFILLLLGEGVVANVNLKKTIAEGQTPWVLITSAWGFSVFVAVFITSQFSGAHLNPAVTIGLAVAEKFSWTLVPGYLISQLLGAMMGSWVILHILITTRLPQMRIPLEALLQDLNRNLKIIFLVNSLEHLYWFLVYYSLPFQT